MSLATVDISKWLYATLTGDATLTALISTRCYERPAPSFATVPLVEWSEDRNTSESSMSESSALEVLYFKVVAVGSPDDAVALEPISDRVDALLKDVQTSHQTWRFTIRRDMEIKRPDVPVGTKRYAHLGGLYKVIVQGTV